MDDTAPVNAVDSEDALRSLYKTPGDVASKKVLSRLDKHCKRFIELSPFLCIATAGADGSADVSPRGDAPGFVGVPDDETVVIPDRVGNNRLDTLANVLFAQEQRIGAGFGRRCHDSVAPYWDLKNFMSALLTYIGQNVTSIVEFATGCYGFQGYRQIYASSQGEIRPERPVQFFE